jgi:PKD domain
MLLIPAGGASAAGWLPPVNASATAPNAGGVASLQDVTVNGQGNAVAAWIQASIDGPEVIKAATRPAGGPWSNSVVISDADEGKVGLKLVANAEGDAAIVWIGQKGGKQIAHVATRPAGGDWSEPAALSDVERYAREPDLAIDEQGAMTAIWREGKGPGVHGVVKAATRPAGGEWSESVELSDGDGEAASPQIVVDPQGEITAVWVLNTGSRSDGVIQSKTRPASGEWSAEPVDVSGENGLASVPRIAVDAQGDATVVWQQRDIPAANGFYIFVQTAHRVDGTWSDPLSLTREDWLSTKPELTADPQGNVTAIWRTGEPGTATRYLQVRSRSAAGSWGAPFDLVTKSGLSEPGESDLQLAADPQGNVTAIWTAWSAPTYVVRSARLPFGGTWSTPVDVSSAAGYSLLPRLAVDPQGYATVLWSGSQGGAHAVRSRVFDPVAPELRDLVVPTTGTVGQPVAMSVDPFDVWSPVATTWAFGDAGAGAGTTVSHCYSSPGERTVTATGADAAGNASSTSQTITIEPDPALVSGSDPCGDPGPGPGPDPGPGPEPGPGPGPTPDPDSDLGPDPDPDPGQIAPVLSGLRQSSSRWRTRAVDQRPQLPIGTTFRFRLNRAADLKLPFSRIVPGGKAKPHGTLRMAGDAGANAFGFRGKIRGRTLAPGSYRLTMTAHADGMTSAGASIEFTIVR